MRIGILSDSHGRKPALIRALQLLQEHGAELLLHCGDIEDADTIPLFIGTPTHFVFGNCDWDKASLRRAIKDCGLNLHEPFGHLQLEGREIAWVHSDDRRLFQELQESDAFDYLFYGHTHHAEEHRVGRTLVVNPGALHRAAPKTCVILDLAAEKIVRIEVIA